MTLSCTCDNSVFLVRDMIVFTSFRGFQSALFAAYEVGSVFGRIGIPSIAMDFKLLGAKAYGSS